MQDKKKKSDKKSDNFRGKAHAYLKYSALAFQLFFVLFLAYYFGQKLDKNWNDGGVLFTAIFIFLGLGGVFYKLIKDLNNGD